MGANTQAKTHPPEDPTTKGQEDPKNVSMAGAQQISTRAQDRVKGEEATGDKDAASLVDNKQAVINIGGRTSTKGEDHPQRLARRMDRYASPKNQGNDGSILGLLLWAIIPGRAAQCIWQETDGPINAAKVYTRKRQSLSFLELHARSLHLVRV